MESLKAQIQKLQQSLNGNLEHDAPVREEIAKLKAQLEGRDTKPTTQEDSQFECIGCGS